MKCGCFLRRKITGRRCKASAGMKSKSSDMRVLLRDISSILSRINAIVIRKPKSERKGLKCVQ